ncbi:50S ribosomal protein L30 [bacterium]|nr:50S ribosomal protein L30 [bacterium]MBU1985470.1 50S ribosomal protein L30 [bacterium]
MEKKLKITLKRSTVRRPWTQKQTVRALGLHRLHETRVIPDNPATRGMVRCVSHLLECEEVQE